MPKGNVYSTYNYKIIDSNKKVHLFRTSQEVKAQFGIPRSCLYQLCKNNPMYKKKKYSNLKAERIWCPVDCPPAITVDWD